MSDHPTPLHGATLYRIGFAVFIIGCLINAFDAYVGYCVSTVQGGSPTDMGLLYETWAFLGLAFILNLECVGLVMFKWMRRQLDRAIGAI